MSQVTKHHHMASLRQKDQPLKVKQSALTCSLTDEETSKEAGDEAQSSASFLVTSVKALEHR